jgi:hypothetical protein
MGCEIGLTPLGGGVQCPNNDCGLGTPTPFQCVGSVCGYMSTQYANSHENEWDGTLYSNSEWKTFLANRVDAQRQALADAISMNSTLTWQQAYDALQYQKTTGSNADFRWTGDINSLNFIPGYDIGGCEVACRVGSLPAIHMSGNYTLHLDAGNPLWGFGLGAFVHGFVDVLFGNINPSVPRVP